MFVWWFQSLASCAVGLELPFAKGEVKARPVQVPFKVVVQCVPKVSASGCRSWSVPQYPGMATWYLVTCLPGCLAAYVMGATTRYLGT